MRNQWGNHIRVVARLLVVVAMLWLSGGSGLLAQDGMLTYTVVSGDTLGAIATRYGTTVERLVEVNGLPNANVLEVGQQLLIPVGDAAAPAAPVAAVETVVARARPGESLASFAARHGQEVGALAALNEMSEAARLFPGQPVLVPREAALPEPLRFGAVESVETPEQVVQGRTGHVVVESRRPISVTATWNDLPIAFAPVAGNPLRQFAYLPAPALIAPNLYGLSVTYVSGNGTPLTRSWLVPIVAGVYETQDIVLPPDRDDLLEPSLVQSEAEKVGAVWSMVSPSLHWSAAFTLPVSSEFATTSPFGTRRSYNSGPVASYHEGQDFGVPEGVPVLVPGDGVVALAEPLNVRGNAVILDHGRGVFTGYWHLSELTVTPGQQVSVGDVLGVSGNTGLSTGAHLHWELRVYGVAVDPMQFMTEPLMPSVGE